MSFSKAPIRRFNDPNIAVKNQKGKIQKSQSGFQKKTLHSPRNLKNNKENAEQLTDLQPLEAQQCSLPKVQEHGNKFLIELEQKFEELPGKLCEVGRDAITNRDGLVTWLSKLKKKYNMVAGDIELLDHHIQEGDNLKMRWEEANKEETLLMKEVKQMCAEKVLNLEKENLQLTELNKQLEVTSEEVKTLNRLKDALEEKVKQSNEKIKLMEQRLTGEEKKLKELLHQNSTIEKLLETEKSSDLCNSQLQQQLNELNNIVEKKEALIKELKTSQDELSLRLQTEMKSKAEESVRLKQAQQQLDKKEEQIQTLSQDLCNLKQLLKRSEEQAACLSAQLGKLYNSGPDHQVLTLKKQMGDVRVSLAEVVRRNQELESVLSNKQLELEQKDRMIQEQRKVLKVRDELIGLLKGKEKRQEETIAALQNALLAKQK